MTTLRFRAPVACVLLLWTCGGSKVLNDTAMTAPAGGRDGGEESTPSSAVCGDIGTDSHNCGACRHDCAGGACSAGICQPVVLAAGLTRPGSMAIDDANVYWTEHSVGRVLSVAKAGGVPMVLADRLTNPGAIAAYAGTVYWTDAVAGTVSSLAVDGGTPVVVATGLPQPDTIVVDATDVYFWNIGDGTVRRLAEPSVVVATGEAVLGMALDAANLYYGTANGSIIKVPRGGGSAESLFAGPLTASGGPQYPAWGLALDSEKVYWISLALFSNLPPGLVSFVPLDGGPNAILCTGCAGTAIAADPSGVYWTENYTGKITSFRGGRRSPVASGQEYPEAIATDATSVYWLNFGPTDLVDGSPADAGGAIMRIAK